MNRLARHLFAGLVVLTCAASASAGVADVDWPNTTLYQHKDYNAVNENGGSAFSLGESVPLRMQGIVLNNPEDMLDQTPIWPNPIPFNLGAQWQVFVQPIDPDDFGGTAVYMAQHYGNVPPNLDFSTTPPTTDPTESYTNAEWDAEMARINYDRTVTTHQFRAGDLVEIHAQAGRFYGGKLNVNEDHSKYDVTDFELELLTAGYGLPTPIGLELADVWDGDPVTGRVLFDPTRLSGGEHYQGSLVELMNVKLVGDGSNWAANSNVNVVDADGRVFPMRLGLQTGFDSMAAPVGYFHVTGIFNQENTSDYTAGYEVWVMDSTGIVLPGDYNDDGLVDAADYTAWRDTLGSTTDLQADGNRSGSIDPDDYQVWKGNFGATLSFPGSGSVAVQQVPEPLTLSLTLAAAASTAWMRRGRGLAHFAESSEQNVPVPLI